MLIIAGSGMGHYSFANIHAVFEKDLKDLSLVDCVVADKNFDSLENQTTIEKYKNKFFFGSFLECKNKMIALEKQNKNILYIVSGSPFFYSGAEVILKSIEKEIPTFHKKNVKIISASSSLDSMVQFLKIDMKNLQYISLHGRRIFEVDKPFQKKWTLILCDKDSLEVLCQYCQWLDDKALTFYLGFCLGCKDEKIEKHDLLGIRNLLKQENSALLKYPLTVAIKKNFDSFVLPLKQEDFFRDQNMITSFDKRQIALTELQLHSAKILWDMGAGSGSVGLEASLSYHLQMFFFEKKKERIDAVKKNLRKFYVMGVRIIEGDFLQKMQNTKPKPDRIFMGGGGINAAKNLVHVLSQLQAGGIFVAFYVAIDTLSVAINHLQEQKIKFSLKSILLTHFAHEQPKISQTERELFILKIVKEDD